MTMAQESKAQHPAKDGPPDGAVPAAAGATDAVRGALQPPSSPPSLSFGTSIAAAVASSVVICAVLGICEQIVGRLFFTIERRWELWPRDIVIAAAGRVVTTHLLFWTPILAACGTLYWLLARRRTDPVPEPFFLALFTLLATAVVVPADLEIAGCLRRAFLAAGLIVGLGVSALVYFMLRGLRRRIGRRWFQLWFRIATTAAVIVTLVTGFYFVRSPLLNPGAYRVAPGNARSSASEHTNVLWIVLDAARADRFGVYGHDAPTTPFLDEWARQSIVFDRAIADAIWTLPSHASMFTGLPACTHGCGYKTDFLDDSFRTVAEVLQKHGYATGCFSNNPFVSPQTNLSQGFDTPLVLYHFQRATRFSLALLCEKLGLTPPVPWLDYDYGAALTNCLVARWLDQHADAPVFVFVNYMETHLPYRAPKRCRQPFLPGDGVRRSYELRRKVYGQLEDWLGFHAIVDGYENMPVDDREIVKRQYEAAVRYLDERVGEVIEIFRRRGLLDHTLVVIAADHGEYLDTHGLWSHYFLTYQDVLHVPLVLRPPGWTDPRRVEQCVQLSELYPTVLRTALGAEAVAPGRDTRDLLDVAGGGGEPRIAISEYFGPEPSVEPRLRAKKDPQVRHRAAAQIAAVDTRFKYIRSGDGMREMYDLLVDPGELNNLAYSHWSEARRLERYIERWLKVVPEYQPKPKPDGAPGPGRDTMKLLKALGYISDED
jgi:arylsulfatase A-like enzyme